LPSEAAEKMDEALEKQGNEITEQEYTAAFEELAAQQ
jgi:hypothetical protein